MITIYTYKGKFGSVPADYIPCLVGFKEGLQPSDLDDEAYFETSDEITPDQIVATQRSKWFCSATAIISVRYNDGLLTKLGYALADELLTAGVNF